LVQVTLAGLLAAVMIRSLLAAPFIPLVIGMGQALSPQLLMPMGVMPTDWLTILLNPGDATDVLSGAVSAQPPAPTPEQGLIAKRQDLSKE